MKNHGMDVYLNGIRMIGKRCPPVIESDKFVRAVVTDLFDCDGRKHRCNEDCNGVWTIAIGADYTDKSCFEECLPRYNK